MDVLSIVSSVFVCCTSSYFFSMCFCVNMYAWI